MSDISVCLRVFAFVSLIISFVLLCLTFCGFVIWYWFVIFAFAGIMLLLLARWADD